MPKNASSKECCLLLQDSVSYPTTPHTSIDISLINLTITFLFVAMCSVCGVPRRIVNLKEKISRTHLLIRYSLLQENLFIVSGGNMREFDI